MGDCDIQLFRPVYHVEECVAAVRAVLESGWSGLGNQTLEFERLWCQKLGFSRAHFVSSATAALQLAVRILKDAGSWKDGDEVITTPLTFVSTNHVLLQERLTPVFADVDIRSHCLDPVSVERLITPATKAVMYVGFGGSVHGLPEIWKLCNQHGLKLIVDASHMTGTRVNGKHQLPVDAMVYSFHSVKNLPTADGGMICFMDAEHDREARRLSWLGIDKTTYERSSGAGGGYSWMYDVPELGYKCHGNSVMAALGIVALKHLDLDNAYRRQLAAWYRQLLVDEIRLATPSFSPPYDRALAFVDHDCAGPNFRPESSRHLIQIRVTSKVNRNKLMEHLRSRRIFAGVHYRLNTEYPMYSNSRRDGRLLSAECISETVISLPNHLLVGFHDVERVCEVIREFFQP